MKKTVPLSVKVSSETRKILKKMAADKEKTMAEFVEEMIILRWKELISSSKDGII